MPSLAGDVRGQLGEAFIINYQCFSFSSPAVNFRSISRRAFLSSPLWASLARFSPSPYDIMPVSRRLPRNEFRFVRVLIDVVGTLSYSALTNHQNV